MMKASFGQRAGKEKETIHMVLNDAVKKLLEEQMWYLATCAEEPNAVPPSFEKVDLHLLCQKGEEILKDERCKDFLPF